METNLITKKIIGCAIEVHKCLGPGLLESAYRMPGFLNCRIQAYKRKD